MKIEKYKRRGETLYKFRVTLPAEPLTGKRPKIQRSGFKSKLEAEKAYIKIKGTIPKRGELKTFEDVFNAFVKFKQFEVKESTLIRMISTYNNHLKDLGSRAIGEIKSTELQQLVFDLYENFQTPHKMFLLVEQIFRYAYKQRIIEENPCDFVSKPRRKASFETENYYTKEELKQFLVCSKRDLSHMWYVFFHLLAYSGLRRGEALSLKWTEFDENGVNICRTISRGASGHVVSETPKTDTSRRYVLLDEMTIFLINSLDKTSEFIFPNSKGSFITPSQPVRQLRKVKGVRYITPHGFRHTHCSLLFAAGASIPEVQHRLGHKDVKTTLNIYNHIYKEDAEEAVRKFVRHMAI